jgi:hypothetical protein
MRLTIVLLAASLLVPAGSSAFARFLYEGQYPAPPALANRMALPECGFAATERWGPNGFQYCDPKNIYPPLYPRSVRPAHRRSYR